ncbi:malic enzyme-like NAD(P)-binding protein [Candidatus Vidania fulgoroideorum]
MKKKEKKLYKKSIKFHKKPRPGKIEIKLKKEIKNKKDLSLAYSPGVASVCLKIKKKEKYSFNYTSRGNLVGVISNGTAVLGLGNIGPAASKPVMEGKAILFKKFGKIDAYDLEVSENNPKKFVKIVKSLEKTFGGINLEDIKSPECFYIEKKCKKEMKIPVFHDDQHGTAIVVTAALNNALKIVKKKIKNIKTVCIGAGAAAISCLNLLVEKGMKKKNIFVYDIKGFLNIERKLNKYSKVYSKKKNIKIKDALEGADFFLGLSSGNVLKGKYIKKMNKNPIIFALANPKPEISVEEINLNRKDCIIATGRSDFENQVNNLLCFPYLFRAALDMKIKKINKKIKIITSDAISKIGYEDKNFCKKKIIPNIFDKNLLTKIPLYIAKKIKLKNFSIKKYSNFLKKL